MIGSLFAGISGLNANSTAMTVIGDNIANVNTEGYSRQVVDLGTRPPQISDTGYIGSGVDAIAVRRKYDDYLALRVRDYTSAYEEFSVYHERARQIDDVIPVDPGQPDKWPDEEVGVQPIKAPAGKPESMQAAAPTGLAHAPGQLRALQVEEISQIDTA